MNESFLSLNTDEALSRLTSWNITGIGLHPGGSNYVFVVRLEEPPTRPEDTEPDAGSPLYGIYKPQSGERPLRDFPYGTLHKRERAAFVLSRSLGWPLIPPTVVRDGPHGEGSVQFFIDADEDANYFTMRDECLGEFEPTAMFDVLVHNADRKGGSCLMSDDGRVWAIDHGLTFNGIARRRTVMFEFNGQPYPDHLERSLESTLYEMGNAESLLALELEHLIGQEELSALRKRGERMLESGTFPVLDPNFNVPWPFV